MSSDSSANKGPIEDRFASYNKFENELLNEIAICSDSDKKERLTWKLATFYIETTRPDKAFAPLQWILETTQNNESKKDSLQALRFLTGEKEGTIPVSYENLDLPEVLWQMGNVYLGKGNQQPGVLCLLRLLELSSDQEKRAECFLLLGAECEKVKDYVAATEFYQRGISCGPAGIRTRYFLNNNMGYCLIQSGDHDSAEKMCLEAIRILPDRHNAHKNLGLALQGQGKYIEAAYSLMKATLLNPMDPRAISELEEIVGEQGEVFEEIPGISDQIVSLKIRVEQVTKRPSINRSVGGVPSMPTFDEVWGRIEGNAGETFQQVMHQEFTYEVRGGSLRPSTVNRNIPRSHFQQAYGMLPLKGPGQINHLQGPSYIFGVLMDGRIRQGDW